MKFISQLIGAILLPLLTLSSVSVAASDPFGSKDTDLVAKYLLNFGAYLGYNLDVDGDKKPQIPSTELLPIPETQLIQTLLVYSTIGSIPVLVEKAAEQLVSSDKVTSEESNFYKNQSNATFKDYSSVSSSTKVSISPLIDQKTYQNDPVSQAVLNILTTPNSAYCYSGTTKSKPTKDEQECLKTPDMVLPQQKVMQNILEAGVFFPTQFLSYDWNKKFLNQLNSNVLLAPLMYSEAVPPTDTPPNSLGSSFTPTNSSGLPVESEAQLAANFIRYVSGAVTPLTLPTKDDIAQLWKKLASNGTSALQKEQIQTSLLNYFSRLRVYAAQSSVGFSNLYYILSKRITQDTKGVQTSQALNEYKMASWRLFNPSHDNLDEQWLAKINKASPATVQKEIAILLAEINYQMYLNRQQEERILLTNTTMLFQNALKHENQPSLPEDGEE